ncbi:MAG: NADH-quinone oxidoreductase subunit NuoE [Chloroflexi bacterium]|nr:NADH-quinone oxidoreductase subunit NuoE [Chloroflexota bacterium]
MSTDLRKQMRELLDPLQGHKVILIPALQAVQEKFGYLPEAAMEEIGRVAGVSPNVVYGVASFYAQFRTTPVGKKHVTVCQGTACHVRGAARILEAIERALDIKAGETTPDLGYSLETVACIGACALAPTLRVNEDTHGKLTTNDIEKLFSKIARQEETSDS